MAHVLQRDAQTNTATFTPRAYFRICIGLICELTPQQAASSSSSSPSPSTSSLSSSSSSSLSSSSGNSNGLSGDNNSASSNSAFGMLAALAAAFNALQPLRIPAFAFAWLELISYRGFMPKLLQWPRQKGWPHQLRLLVGLLRFLEPYLVAQRMTDPIRLLYKGTLRTFLVLLHDFPEFLAECYLPLVDAIPPTCMQLRNLVLSAFPRHMRLPDPLTPNLKVICGRNPNPDPDPDPDPNPDPHPPPHIHLTPHTLPPSLP